MTSDGAGYPTSISTPEFLNPLESLTTSYFAMFSDVWLPSSSTIIFSDNIFDAIYSNSELGTIMFTEF